MKKVSPINRALRPAGKSSECAANTSRALNNRAAKASVTPLQSQLDAVAPPLRQSQATHSSREELHGLFENYHAREQAQQYQYLEERLSDAVTELKAKVGSQELQIQSLQSMVDSERRLSQSAIANLKDLFDGNYRVMADISDKYEDSHEALENDRASFDRRLDFIQQESHDNTSQLRTALIRSQDEDRARLAESLRALADSIERKPNSQ